jgi:solute carrier family 35 protein F5
MSDQEPPVTISLAERFTSDEPSLSAPSSHHARRSGSSIRSAAKREGLRAHIGLETVSRRTLGIVLLIITVLLFTASSFLGSVSPPQY